MRTLWDLTGRLFRLYLALGIVLTSLGLALYTIFGNEFGSIEMMTFGAGGLILGLVGYTYGTFSTSMRGNLPLILGITFTVIGVIVSSFDLIPLPLNSRLGLVGLTIFSLGPPLIVSVLIKSRPLNIKGIYAFGIGFILLSAPLIYLSTLNGNLSDGIYASLIPLIGGFEAITFSRASHSFIGLDKPVNIRSGN